MPAPATPRIIREEHATLSAVLRTMLMLVRDAHQRNGAPDFRALRAMLFYVDEFPEKIHHVRESTLLFPRLRECTPDAHDLLERLDRDHQSGHARLRELEHELTAWELLGEARRATFETALDGYAQRYLEHMRSEEDQVLPLAERVFGEADWTVLDRAFRANQDPLHDRSPETPYLELFRKIVTITPAPYGVGAPAGT